MLPFPYGQDTASKCYNLVIINIDNLVIVDITACP